MISSRHQPVCCGSKSLIDVNVATIFRTGYADREGASVERISRIFSSDLMSELRLYFSSSRSLPEESKNGRGLEQYKKNNRDDILLI